VIKRYRNLRARFTAWWTVGRIASRHLLSGLNRTAAFQKGRLFPIMIFALKRGLEETVRGQGLAAVLDEQVSVMNQKKLKATVKKLATNLKKDKCPTMG